MSQINQGLSSKKVHKCTYQNKIKKIAEILMLSYTSPKKKISKIIDFLTDYNVTEDSKIITTIPTLSIANRDIDYYLEQYDIFQDNDNEYYQMEHYLSLNGDSLPYPETTKEQLDDDLDLYWLNRIQKIKLS